FSSILLHKLSPKALPAAVLGALQDLSEIQVVPTDGGIVRRAVEAHATYGIHFYDGMIVAAAERAAAPASGAKTSTPARATSASRSKTRSPPAKPPNPYLKPFGPFPHPLKA